jgi:uracil-DNA glycosylase
MNWKKKCSGKTLVSLIIPMKEIHPEWRSFIRKESKEDYFKKMYNELKQELIKSDKDFFPEPENCFRIFKYPLSKIKVVILGQDPYYRYSKIKNPKTKQIIQIPQACGLAFSVTPPVPAPVSLKNIYKELLNDPDINFNNPGRKGDLSLWCNQGVCLLNTALSVCDGKPGSHLKIWSKFTDKIIQHLSLKGNKVFMLWGNPAQKKTKLIDDTKNKIIKTSHPSGLSAHKGFLGSRCFSQCNNWLIQKKLNPIDWNVIC